MSDAKHLLFLAEVPNERLSFSLATRGENKENWLKAVNNEMHFLMKNKTWVLVPRENASNELNDKWGFYRKEFFDQNRHLHTNFNARPVTRGFQQIHGTDYEETFA